MEASSVHTPILPWRGCINPFLIAAIISPNPVLMIPSPSLLKGMNSVDAPKASPIAIPKIAATPLEICRDENSS